MRNIGLFLSLLMLLTSISDWVHDKYEEDRFDHGRYARGAAGFEDHQRAPAPKAEEYAKTLYGISNHMTDHCA